jgi:hypothetical protein
VIAKSFPIEVETLRGTKPAPSSSNAKSYLVEAKLEMVRPTWVFRHSCFIRRFCLLSSLDRVQRDEID